DDADDGRPILHLRQQQVGGGGGGRGGGGAGGGAPPAHSVTGVPPAASERVSASSTRTTRTPYSGAARGGSTPRATRTKCARSAARGSTFGIVGVKQSPSRWVRVCDCATWSARRST